MQFLEEGSRQVTLLDGDLVKSHMYGDFGTSKEHRSLNVKRICYMASEITKNGGIAICAPIAPYESDRRVNRELISPLGGFIEIYVNTSLEKYEERDVKGLYKKAIDGDITNMIGFSDSNPYEVPLSPNLTVNTGKINLHESVDIIIKYINKRQGN